MKVTFLGTGTSVGVPRIACDCPVCRSGDPRDQRLRCAMLLEYDGHTVLIDTPPDLRTQVLREDVRNVDAVLFTHAHADHLHGLDDVRCFALGPGESVPCYGDAATIERIRHVFDYAFHSGHPSSVPQLEVHTLDGPFSLLGRSVQPIAVFHGRLPILAYRVGGFAYVTDCSSIPPESMEQLSGLDVLVLDALRHREHPTHFNVAQAVAVAAELAPRRTYLTHIAHDLEHAATNAALPDGVELAYDGLALEVD